MKTQSQSNRTTVRNLLIFALVATSIGWLGWGLDVLMGNPPSQGLGQLLWLVAPLGTALLLRTFADDGWKDFGFRLALNKNAVWYAISLVVFPTCATLIVVIGLVLGLTTLPDFSLAKVGLFSQVVVLGLIPSFIKNIFEEFTWRGYLAPKISSLGLNNWVGHVWVGLIWAAWHIPYYLFFFDRASFAAYTSQSFITFFPMLFAGVLAMSCIYGEIRLLTQSVWSALLLHTVSNAFGNPLILQGFIKMVPGADVFVSPGPESILSIIFYCLIGVGLYRFRKRKTIAT